MTLRQMRRQFWSGEPGDSPNVFCDAQASHPFSLIPLAPSNNCWFSLVRMLKRQHSHLLEFELHGLWFSGRDLVGNFLPDSECSLLARSRQHHKQRVRVPIHHPRPRPRPLHEPDRALEGIAPGLDASPLRDRFISVEATKSLPRPPVANRCVSVPAMNEVTEIALSRPLAKLVMGRESSS